jgi:hypothetical protein
LKETTVSLLIGRPWRTILELFERESAGSNRFFIGSRLSLSGSWVGEIGRQSKLTQPGGPHNALFVVWEKASRGVREVGIRDLDAAHEMTEGSPRDLRGNLDVWSALADDFRTFASLVPLGFIQTSKLSIERGTP